MTGQEKHSKPCGRYHNRSRYERELRQRNPEYAARQRRNSTEWARAHRDHLNEYNRKRRERERRWPKAKREAAAIRKTALYWGVTPEEYAAFKAAAGGRCAICGLPPSTRKGRLHVDHNHTTGMIRGILCHACNYGLGCLKDDPDRLERAAKYLRDSEAKPPLPTQKPRPHLQKRILYARWKTIPKHKLEPG